MASQANLEELLDELYEVLDKGWSLPMSNGKIFVDGEEARAILEEIRDAIPGEFKKAKEIITDSDQIVADAQKEAEHIMNLTKERIQKMITQENIVKEAQVKANEIMLKSQEKCRQMRKASSDYIEEIMRKADETMSSSLADLRKTRQSIKTSQTQKK